MITGTVTGAEAVIAKFDHMPQKLHAKLKFAITRLTLKLQKNVKADKLSGQVLKVRTGTLRRSIDQHVVDTGSAITGRVSTNVKYGKAHEYGFTGTQDVRAHLRTIKQAFGRSINPVSVTVREHSRSVKMPERSFLRSALRDMNESGQIMEALNKAVAEARE
jgi:hypothetical protein